jgi:hypothetical protein
VTTVPRISYARSADGVSLAFTTAGHGPALVFVPRVPFSNFRMERQSALGPALNRPPGLGYGRYGSAIIAGRNRGIGEADGRRHRS